MRGTDGAPIKPQTLAEQLRVLADPTRLLIIDLLMQGVQCNCELSGALQLAPNLVSHHLSVLSQAGLVRAERDASDARWIYYSINKNALEELAAAFGAFFDPGRIKPRHPSCGPQVSLALDAEMTTTEV
jgi:ArsR family transcriptional regulator